MALSALPWGLRALASWQHKRAGICTSIAPELDNRQCWTVIFGTLHKAWLQMRLFCFKDRGTEAPNGSQGCMHKGECMSKASDIHTMCHRTPR